MGNFCSKVQPAFLRSISVQLFANARLSNYPAFFCQLFHHSAPKTRTVCLPNLFRINFEEAVRDAHRRFNSTSQTTQIGSSARTTLTKVEGAVYFVRILIQPEIEGERYKYPWPPDCSGRIKRRQTMFFLNSLFRENHDRNNWQLLMNRNIRRSDKFLLHQKLILKMIHHSMAY